MQIVQDEINWGIQHELIVFWAIFTEWQKIVINILPSQHDLGNFNKDDRETIQSAN
jgi:hypothetical protein